MSLRTRLLAGLITTVVIGLALLGLLTYTGQRSFLLGRVDQQAAAAADAVSFQLDQQGINVAGASPRSQTRGPGPAGAGAQGGSFRGGGPDGGPVRGQGVNLPPGTYGERRDASGKPVGHTVFSYGETALPLPQLPAKLPVSASLQHPTLTTVGSRGSSGLRYRVLAFPTRDETGTTVVAIPLRDVDQTLSRLLRNELIIGGAVLVALVLLTWWVIRVGLRPLDAMGETAAAIAAGDLSRRVAGDDARTEVGRLGRALNAMLHQIETAFREREASERRLRRFIADASHELRTPLAAIRGYAELFRMGAARDPAQTERAMQRIEDEAARMGRLVEDLLTLARLDQLPRVDRAPVDLATLAEDAVADARATDPGREISLEIHGEPVVRGDEGQLRQVLANLTRNALVHTQAGTPIEIRADGDGADVSVEVRDHGAGLPPGQAENVFDRFWRAEGGRERGPAGAGLGLAIVAAIVEAHGGRAAAANAADGGARFTVTLPGWDGGSREDAAPAPRGEPAASLDRP